MKYLKNALLVLGLAFYYSSAYAQTDNPVDYMNQFTIEYNQLQKDMWDYTRSVSHGRSARKVEKRRMELIQSSDAALKKAQSAADYNGDTDFRDAVIEYFSIINLVLKEDYEKIVDMEEVAEESYDLMEAYLMAREAASERQREAAEMVNRAQKIFAEENDVELIAQEDDLDSKMMTASKVYAHYNEVFLIFFKSNKQELFLIEAINSSDLNAIEKNREALKSSISEGLDNLETVEPYEGDKAMIEATKSLFKFYEKEVEDAQLAADYFEKKQTFEKVKETFDKIKEKDRTQADVDKYNNAINELNAAADAYQKSSESNNKERSILIDNWNTTAEKFTNKHVPRGR